MEQINVDNLIVDDKGDIVKKPKHSVKYSKDNALEESEKSEIFRAIKELNVKPEIKYKYEVLVHLMMTSGLRVSEALQVRLDWFVESEDGILLRIPDKARDLANLKRDWKPKTKAGKREVIFTDKGVGEKVRSYFISNKSIGMLRQRAYQVIKLLGTKMNKPGIHPHALRSTYANTLIYLGVNESTICYYMGWDNLETARHYFKTSNVAARKNLLDKVNNGGF